MTETSSSILFLHGPQARAAPDLSNVGALDEIDQRLPGGIEMEPATLHF
ncbi:MAG TPA: hypothetical protein VF988_06385 [Verrucomicrobiae bacterium]